MPAVKPACATLMWRPWPVAMAGLCALAVLLPTGASAAELYRWLQYVPGGLEARAVTDAAQCPPASIDGKPAVMSERAPPGGSFPVRTCFLAIAKEARQLSVADAPLPLPKARAERILIIGDTGCRISGKQVQACNDIAEWPFRRNAEMAASFKPDLIIHVGDVHYRDKACPSGNSGCAGSPFGDNWLVWKEDFFKPAAALLPVAPWVMVRGNHEDCRHGDRGWARTLDAYPFAHGAGSDACLGPEEPYSLDIGGVTILVIDVSMAGKFENKAQLERCQSQFQSAASLPGPVWLAIHRPIWAVENVGSDKDEDDGVLDAAARHSLPANIAALISGHHHTFEVMGYVQDLPVQVVSGHGGDELAPHAPDTVKGLRINDVEVKDGIARPHRFGFSMIERATARPGDTTWQLTGYDTQGHPIGACAVNGREVRCDTPPAP
ncbi:MAG: metallophosphoesterase [Alphaproteobacteria bacterium]|nr:metallophosphoesterase [Alphaproteobacteria bacterium]